MHFVRDRNFPESLEKIGESSFTECSGMKNITFPPSSQLTDIARNAFQQSGIVKIDLPLSLKKLGKEAFNRCRQLVTISISKATTAVDAQAFTSCSKLVTINVDNDNPVYASLDGMLVSKDKKRLKAFPPGKANSRYTRLPAFIEAIDSAFYSCEELTNITIPKTVTAIGNFAFSNTKNLKSISFLGNIPTLYPDAFLNTDTRPITLFVRKAWFENPANASKITEMKARFKDVHPSFIVGGAALDRGVEYFPISISTVGVIGFKPERTSVIVPDKALEKDYIYNGTPITTNYDVATVLDYAFENNAATETVVFLGPLEEIGLNAFSGTDNHIRDIYFVDEEAPEMASVSFETPIHYPFKPDQNIYVKQSAVNDYKDAFTDPQYTGTNITDRVMYQIPHTTARHGGSVCYPFNVKFDNRNTQPDDIKPYLPLIYKETPKLILVKARSIDDYCVPANTGVLIRNKQKATATSYCQIDEDQTPKTIDITGYVNKMQGTVEDTTFVDNTKTYFVFNKKIGKFQKANNRLLPYFKSYLELGASAAAKQIIFSIDDESETTDIIDINTDDDTKNAPWYRIDGTRVEQPRKGIYIRNGKK